MLAAGISLCVLDCVSNPTVHRDGHVSFETEDMDHETPTFVGVVLSELGFIMNPSDQTFRLSLRSVTELDLLCRFSTLIQMLLSGEFAVASKLTSLTNLRDQEIAIAKEVGRREVQDDDFGLSPHSKVIKRLVSFRSLVRTWNASAERYAKVLFLLPWHSTHGCFVLASNLWRWGWVQQKYKLIKQQESAEGRQVQDFADPDDRHRRRAIWQR